MKILLFLTISLQSLWATPDCFRGISEAISSTAVYQLQLRSPEGQLIHWENTSNYFEFRKFFYDSRINLAETHGRVQFNSYEDSSDVLNLFRDEGGDILWPQHPLNMLEHDEGTGATVPFFRAPKVDSIDGFFRLQDLCFSIKGMISIH